MMSKMSWKAILGTVLTRPSSWLGRWSFLTAHHVGFSILIVYAILLGLFLRAVATIKQRPIIVADITGSAFGLLVQLGPASAELLSEKFRRYDILLFGHFNRANVFALDRINGKSPPNVRVHRSHFFSFINLLYRPGRFAHPVVSVWSRSRYLKPLFPMIYPAERLKEEARREYSPSLVQTYFRLTDAEADECKGLLESAGLNLTSGFVCFNARDDAWRQKKQSSLYDSGIHRLTNMDVTTYLPAMEHVLSSGFAVIRVGRETETPIELPSPNFLDYSKSNLRNDRMDFFLGEHCILSVSNGTGWDTVPRAMGRPVHLANFGDPGFGGNDFFWSHFFPPITVGFRRFFSEKTGRWFLGSSHRERVSLLLDEPHPRLGKMIYKAQDAQEIKVQVAFALRLATDPHFLEQSCRDQESFQLDWFRAYASDTASIPKWRPLLEPGYLQEFGQSLTDSCRWKFDDTRGECD